MVSATLVIANAPSARPIFRRQPDRFALMPMSSVEGNVLGAARCSVAMVLSRVEPVSSAVRPAVVSAA